jgi:hypothetical protein
MDNVEKVNNCNEGDCKAITDFSCVAKCWHILRMKHMGQTAELLGVISVQSNN